MRSAAEVGSGSGGVQGVALDCPVEAAWELCSDWTHWQRWWPGNLKCELREGENRKPSCLRVQLMPGVCNYERLLECEDGKRFTSGCRALSPKPSFERQRGRRWWPAVMKCTAVEGYNAEMMSIGMQVFNNTDLEKAAQRLATGFNPKPEDTTEADTAH